MFSIFILNSLPKETNLGWSKMKGLADDKINVTEKLKFFLKRVENIVGKGENSTLFLKGSYTWSLKVGIVW